MGFPYIRDYASLPGLWTNGGGEGFKGTRLEPLKDLDPLKELERKPIKDLDSLQGTRIGATKGKEPFKDLEALTKPEKDRIDTGKRNINGLMNYNRYR